MQMDIHAIIVHKIEKGQREQGQPAPIAIITPRKTELSHDDELVIDLLDYVWKAYKTGKTFGSFDGDTDNYPVQQWLKNYLDKPAENLFIPLTNQIMNRLKQQIENQNFATGGHILFAHLTKDDQPWCNDPQNQRALQPK
ncbi:hypothetical protein D5085_07610 [Ectothiorhodospiraceae bacterium BW-2]|nr:hypothetical protein D5085_07610 [Ectothiorhodospiraceae bacterium BW-2]